MILLQNLTKNPLFAHIDQTDIEKMLVCFEAQRREYDEKDVVTVYGSSREKIGLLLSGTVSLNRINADGNLDMLEYIDGTGIFGDSFSFANQDDEFMVICEKKCTVLFIDKFHITKRCPNACLHHSIVVENLIQLMANKVVTLSEKVDILSHRTIRSKLLSYFRLQSAKNGSQTFRLPFSYLSLANFLCVDRSAMTRELKRMKEEGLLFLNGKEITLL